MSYILNNPGIVWNLVLEHLQMTSLTLVIAVAIALPLALLITRYRWLNVPVLGALGILYTVPSLALIILLVPIFGLDAQSVIAAMVIYTQVILVRNLAVGLQSIKPAVLEAARGMGMNPWQRWWQIQVPLILPIFLAGLRIAAIVRSPLLPLAQNLVQAGWEPCCLTASTRQGAMTRFGQGRSPSPSLPSSSTVHC